MKALALVGVLCVVAWTGPLAAAADDGGKHLFILSGQSNMRQPLPDSFEEAVAAVFGKDNVIVVARAHPSQPIRQWYKDWQPPLGTDMDGKPNGKLYDALMQGVNRAIKGKKIATVTFIWMQGEADAGKGWGSVYEKSFLGVVAQIRNDLGRDDVNFVLGRINDNYLSSNGTQDGDLVRAIQKKLGEEHANGDWVNTDDVNMGVNPWGGYNIGDGHFPPAGYIVMGKRFARRACKLIDPTIKLDPAIFAESFIDTSDDVKTHAAIGNPVMLANATPTDQNTTNLELLTDGKFGDTKPTDKAWLRVASESKDVSFVVDLGSETELTGVGISILINKQVKAGYDQTRGHDVR